MKTSERLKQIRIEAMNIAVELAEMAAEDQGGASRQICVSGYRSSCSGGKNRKRKKILCRTRMVSLFQNI